MITVKRHVLILTACTAFLLFGCRGTLANRPPATQTPMVVVVTSGTGDISSERPSVLGGGEIPTDYPPSFACSGQFIEQPFENGRMFWLGLSIEERCRPVHAFEPGTGVIFVLVFDSGGDTGTWLRFVDDWDPVSEPESDPSVQPPEGLLEPIRGFGHVWRNKLTEAERQALGWATLNEVPFVAPYEYISGGTVGNQDTWVSGPGVHMLQGYGGTQYSLDEKTYTFTVNKVEEETDTES